MTMYTLRKADGSIMGSYSVDELRLMATKLQADWELSPNGVKWYKVSSVKGLFPETLDLGSHSQVQQLPPKVMPIQKRPKAWIFWDQLEEGIQPIKAPPNHTTAILLAFLFGMIGLLYASKRVAITILSIGAVLVLISSIVAALGETGLIIFPLMYVLGMSVMSIVFASKAAKGDPRYLGNQYYA